MALAGQEGHTEDQTGEDRSDRSTHSGFSLPFPEVLEPMVRPAQATQGKIRSSRKAGYSNRPVRVHRALGERECKRISTVKPRRVRNSVGPRSLDSRLGGSVTGSPPVRVCSQAPHRVTMSCPSTFCERRYFDGRPDQGSLFAVSSICGSSLLFAQVRLFTYLPKIHAQLDEVLRHLEAQEESQA